MITCGPQRRRAPDFAGRRSASTALAAAPVGLVASGVEEDRIDTASAPGPPRVGGPERASDEDRLEESANKAFRVGVEPEGVGPLEPLGDIAREDHDEEPGHNPADHRPTPTHEDQREAEDDLDDAGQQHDEVGVDWEPDRDLGLELVALRCQMTDAGDDEAAAEHQASNWSSGRGHLLNLRTAARTVRPDISAGSWWPTAVARVVVAALTRNHDEVSPSRQAYREAASCPPA